MSGDPPVPSIVRACAQALQDGRIVAFVGAGISAPPPSSLPLARSLGLQILEELCCEGEKRSPDLEAYFHDNRELFKSIAESAPPEFVYQSLWNFLPQHGGHPFADDHPFEEPLPRLFQRLRKAKPNSNHRLLASLAASGHLRIIVTTNFDTLLEEALEDTGVPYSVTVEGDIDVLPQDRVLLFKIHGCLSQPDSLTFSLGQVGRGLSMDKRSLLSYLLREFPFLFLGWSDNDIDLTPIIARSVRQCFWIVHDKDRREACDWITVASLPEMATQLSALLSERRMLAIRCDTMSLLGWLRSQTESDEPSSIQVADAAAGEARGELDSTPTIDDGWLQAAEAPERLLAVCHLLDLSGFSEQGLQVLGRGIEELAGWHHRPAFRRLLHLQASLEVRIGDREKGLRRLRRLIQECDRRFPFESWIALLNYCTAYTAVGDLEVAIPALALSYHVLTRIREHPIRRTGEPVFGTLLSSELAEEYPVTLLREAHYTQERAALALHIAGCLTFTVAVTWWHRGEIRKTQDALTTAEQALRDSGSLVEAAHVASARLVCANGSRWEQERVQWYKDYIHVPTCQSICSWALDTAGQKTGSPRQDPTYVLKKFPALPVYPDFAAFMIPPADCDVASDLSHRAHRLMTRELDAFFKVYIHPSKITLDESQSLDQYLLP